MLYFALGYGFDIIAVKNRKESRLPTGSGSESLITGHSVWDECPEPQTPLIFNQKQQ